MKTIKYAKKIEEKIKLLEIGREKLLDSAKFKAESIGNYKKKLALVTIKLRAGKPMSLDGEVIEACPVTIIKTIAEGICWEELTQMELATGEYKANIVKMESVQSELNGYQSANKWLESN